MNASVCSSSSSSTSTTRAVTLRAVAVVGCFVLPRRRPASRNQRASLNVSSSIPPSASTSLGVMNRISSFPLRRQLPAKCSGHGMPPHCSTASRSPSADDTYDRTQARWRTQPHGRTWVGASSASRASRQMLHCGEGVSSRRGGGIVPALTSSSLAMAVASEVEKWRKWRHGATTTD